MKTPFVLTICFLLALSATAQKQVLCDTCPCLLEQARLNARIDKNGEAISLYQAYLVCEPTKVADVTAEIKEIQQKTERQKDLERRGKMLEKKLRGEADGQRKIAEARTAESRRNARAGHNLAATLRTLQTDPTLAARMAEMSLKEHADDEVTQQVFADIISNPDNYFYRRQGFEGHKRGIARLAVSPDGKYLATYGFDRTVKLWHSNGDLLFTFDSLTTDYGYIQFSKDSVRLLIYGSDWAILSDTSGKRLGSAQLRRDGTVAVQLQAAISPDGGKWVWHDEKGRLILQSSATGQRLDSLALGANRINKLVFSPDNSFLLVCGSTDTTTLLWDISNKKRIPLQGHSRVVSNGFFSPEGKKVASYDRSGLLRVWSLEGDSLDSFVSESKLIKDAFFVNEDSILVQTSDQTVALRPGGSQNVRPFNNLGNQILKPYPAGERLLLIGKTLEQGQGQTSELAVRVFQKDGGYRTRFGVYGENAFPAWAGETPEGDIVMYFLKSGGATFHSYRYTSRKPMSFTLPRPKSGRPSNNRWNSCVPTFSHDGKYFVYTHPYDSAAVVRLTNVPKEPFFRIKKDSSTVVNISINPQLSDTSRYFFLTLNADGTATLWNSAAREQATYRESGCRVTQAQFFPDGERVLITCADSIFSTYWLWNPRSNQRRLTPIGNYPNLHRAALSPDGNVIALTGKDQRIYLWSIEEQKLKSELLDIESPVQKIIFLPDSQRLLTLNETGQLFLWDISRVEKPLKSWRGYWNGQKTTGWRDVVLSPKGNKMLLIGNGNDALLTDMDGTSAVELDDVYPQSAVFSPDEKYLLIAGWDNVARLWNQQSLYIGSFKGEHAGGVISIAISPDNSRALTTDGMGTTRLWKMPDAFLNDELHHYTPNALIEKDILPSPDQLDAITHAGALYHAAFNFLSQQDSATAYKLFDYLLKKFPNQGEEVWYNWHTIGKSIGHDHIDSLMRQTRILYPLAERFKKDGKYAEAKKMYEYLINKGEGSIPLWDYFDLCQKGGFQVSKDLFLNETNPAKLASSAQYFRTERDFATARLLYKKALQQEINADALIGLDKMNDPADHPLIQEKLASLTDEYELMRLANHFRANGQEPRAATLYEKVLQIREDPQAVIALFEISKTHPQIPFDMGRFEQSQSADVTRQYLWYFSDRGMASMKTKMWKRLFQLGNNSAYDYLDYYQAIAPEEQPAFFDTLLHLESPGLLKSLMNAFASQVGGILDRAERSEYYEKATQLGERLLKLEDKPEHRASLSTHYNSLGFNALFIKEYQKCYDAIQRGIELNPDNLYLYTNLPHALLFMGEKEKAWEAYKKYESRPYYPERQRPFIREAYYFDFEDFRKDYEANPGKNFTEQMMKDMDEMEKRLKALPPNAAKK